MSELLVPKPLAELPNSFIDHSGPSFLMVASSSLVQRSNKAWSSSDKVHSASLVFVCDSNR